MATTTNNIKQKHINLWITYCKTTIVDISDVNEDSDLYVFMTQIFQKMSKYYKKQKDKYDFIYNFLIKGTNFGKNIKEELYMFFKKVVTHLDKEDQIKKLFRTFRLKIQREAFMTKLEKSIEELNDSLQAIVYVRTVITESSDKKYAEERNRTQIAHEKEKQLLKNECEKLLNTNKLLVKMVADKDKMVADKDNLIAEMKEDKKNYEKRINKLENEKEKMENEKEKMKNEKEKMEQKLKEMEDKMEKLRDDRDWWMRMCQNTVKK